MLGAFLQRLNVALCHLLMRIEVRGRENLAAAGPRALVVPNHVGLLDPPLPARPPKASSSPEVDSQPTETNDRATATAKHRMIQSPET